MSEDLDERALEAAHDEMRERGTYTMMSDIETIVRAYLRASPAYKAGMEEAARIAEDGWVHGDTVQDVAEAIRARAAFAQSADPGAPDARDAGHGSGGSGAVVSESSDGD